MIRYFGYGSNINMLALKAKGVLPKYSQLALLRGWKLSFNVKHWFRHEGGVGNIEYTGMADDLVQGIVHYCDENDLQKLDRMESYGVGYDRVEVTLETEEGKLRALAYVGLEPFIDDSCLPSQRYLNIIVRGAEEAGLEDWYIQKLKSQAVCENPVHPPFSAPEGKFTEFSQGSLKAFNRYTALHGHVFDMSGAREDLHCLFELFGGKDMTLFHLKRLDTSTGEETIKDVLEGRISEYAQNYLNNYLYEYQKEFEYVGSYNYNDN